MIEFYRTSGIWQLECKLKCQQNSVIKKKKNYSDFSTEMVPYSKNIFKHWRKKQLKWHDLSETK